MYREHLELPLNLILMVSNWTVEITQIYTDNTPGACWVTALDLVYSYIFLWLKLLCGYATL